MKRVAGSVLVISMRLMRHGRPVQQNVALDLIELADIRDKPMNITCEQDLTIAIKARDEARKLVGILQEADKLTGRMDYYGLEVPNVEDAMEAATTALGQIEGSLDRYERSEA